MLDCQGIKLLFYLLTECFDLSLAFAVWHASKPLHNIEELLILLLQLPLSLSPPRTPDELTDRPQLSISDVGSMQFNGSPSAKDVKFVTMPP
jgi:hypothetical protein